MKSTEPVEAEAPFDKFTMEPRNRREFIEAVGYQADQIAKMADRQTKGFGVSHEYITRAVGFMGPVKCLELLYQCAAPDVFKVYFDGRSDSFVIETFPVAKPQKSSLILPGHA